VGNAVDSRPQDQHTDPHDHRPSADSSVLHLRAGIRDPRISRRTINVVTLYLSSACNRLRQSRETWTSVPRA